MSDKLIIQFQNRQFSVDADENDYYRVLGFLTEYTLSKSKTKSLEVKNDSIVIPTSYEVEQYIKSLEGYEFTIDMVSNHFLCDTSAFSKEQLERWDYAIRMKLDRIKKKIASSENGKWESKHMGDHKKMFTFVPEKI